MNNAVADRPEFSINTFYTNIEGKYLSQIRNDRATWIDLFLHAFLKVALENIQLITARQLTDKKILALKICQTQYLALHPVTWVIET